jgi:hypothetical protein
MAQGTTEYLGQLPDERFEHAAHTAFAQAPPAQRQGLLSSLLGALQGRGVDLGGLQHQLGLPSLSPTQMGPDEYAQVANYARRQHPSGRDGRAGALPALIHQGHGQSDRDGGVGDDCRQAAPALIREGLPAWPRDDATPALRSPRECAHRPPAAPGLRRGGAHARGGRWSYCRASGVPRDVVPSHAMRYRGVRSSPTSRPTPVRSTRGARPLRHADGHPERSTIHRGCQRGQSRARRLGVPGRHTQLWARDLVTLVRSRRSVHHRQRHDEEPVPPAWACPTGDTRRWSAGAPRTSAHDCQQR